MTRHWGVLARGWGLTLLLALLLRGFIWYLPLAGEMLRPVYLATLIPGLLGTWRWLRPRRVADRRDGDRRQAARRGDE